MRAPRSYSSRVMRQPTSVVDALPSKAHRFRRLVHEVRHRSFLAYP